MSGSRLGRAELTGLRVIASTTVGLYGHLTTISGGNCKGDLRKVGVPLRSQHHDTTQTLDTTSAQLNPLCDAHAQTEGARENWDAYIACLADGEGFVTVNGSNAVRGDAVIGHGERELMNGHVLQHCSSRGTPNHISSVEWGALTKVRRLKQQGGGAASLTAL